MQIAYNYTQCTYAPSSVFEKYSMTQVSSTKEKLKIKLSSTIRSATDNYAKQFENANNKEVQPNFLINLVDEKFSFYLRVN